MKNRSALSFTVVAIVLGFMLAIQFQTTNEPIVRDTRDMWELRQDLKKAQERQGELIQEIRKYDDLLAKYEEQNVDDQQQTLKDTLADLKEQAGLTEVSGPGIVLTIEPLFDESIIGQQYKSVTPELLSRLINELNSYQATGISVAGQRIISISPIREVAGQTHVNNKRLPPMPFKIYVLAENKERAQRLHNQMIVSQSVEDFAIDNLKLSSTMADFVTLPAYEEPIRIKYMEPANVKKEGK